MFIWRSTNGGYREANAGLLQPLEAHSCCHFLWTYLSCPLKELIWEELGIWSRLGYLLLFCSVHSTHPSSFHCNKGETRPLLQHISIMNLLHFCCRIQREVHVSLIWKERALKCLHSQVLSNFISPDYKRKQVYAHLPWRSAEKQQKSKQIQTLQVQIYQP